jgi:hypothetical protein
MLTVCYHMLRDGVVYEDLGPHPLRPSRLNQDDSSSRPSTRRSGL